MVSEVKFYKHSNTGDLIKSQKFKETKIEGIPIYWYNIYGQYVDVPNLKGYVEISEKKWKRLERKIKRK